MTRVLSSPLTRSPETLRNASSTLTFAGACSVGPDGSQRERPLTLSDTERVVALFKVSFQRLADGSPASW